MRTVESGTQVCGLVSNMVKKKKQKEKKLKHFKTEPQINSVTSWHFEIKTIRELMSSVFPCDCSIEVHLFKVRHHTEDVNTLATANTCNQLATTNTSGDPLATTNTCNQLVTIKPSSDPLAMANTCNQLVTTNGHGKHM